MPELQSRYVGRTAQRLSSRIRQHVQPLGRSTNIPAYWRRFKRPMQPTLRRKKWFRQRHMGWQQRQQLQQQHHQQQRNHHHWQTQRKWQRQLRRQQQQHVQWMQHLSTLRTLLTKRSPQHWKKRMRLYQQGEHLCPVLARKPQAHNHSQEGSLSHHQDNERLWPPKERSVWRLLQMWPPLTSRRKDLHFHELQRHRARYRKRNLKRKRRTINLLLPGTLFRMMFVPVPTMTIYFTFFVFVCPSLVLMWWRPCTLGHLSLTCVHKRPPSPPFNCFVPLSTLFHPFTTLSINPNFNVTFLFVITCFLCHILP